MINRPQGITGSL